MGNNWKKGKWYSDSCVLVGKRNDSPILDIRIYKVAIPDDIYSDCHENKVIENILNTVDDDGRTTLVMRAIIYNWTNKTTILKKDGRINTSNGSSKWVTTTKGWVLKIQLIYISTTWVPLWDRQEVNPIEVAKYTIESSIANEPAC